MAGHIASSSSIDWNTPEEILAPVRTLFGGSIDLDPCSNDGSIVGASVEYRLPENDGLRDPWFTEGVRTVYVNPPFGAYLVHRETKKILLPKEMKAAMDTLGKAEGKVFRAGFDRFTIKDWIRKASEETTKYCGTQAVMCIPAAVGTSAWQKIVLPTAGAVCWLKGRPKFVGAETGSPMDVALVYFGGEIDSFREHFSALGHVSPPRFT